jgi:hypothetical protein
MLGGCRHTSQHTISSILAYRSQSHLLPTRSSSVRVPLLCAPLDQVCRLQSSVSPQEPRAGRSLAPIADTSDIDTGTERRQEKTCRGCRSHLPRCRQSSQHGYDPSRRPWCKRGENVVFPWYVGQVLDLPETESEVPYRIRWNCRIWFVCHSEERQRRRNDNAGRVSTKVYTSSNRIRRCQVAIAML